MPVMLHVVIFVALKLLFNLASAERESHSSIVPSGRDSKYPLCHHGFFDIHNLIAPLKEERSLYYNCSHGAAYC